MRKGFVSIVAVITIISACRKDNPCTGLSPTNASFTIQDYNYQNNGWVPYVTDTVVGGSVLFSAILDSAIYEWHIGAGIYTTQSFSLNFSQVQLGTTIPVTLIVRKTPNTKCFPNDKGVDTLTKNMYISSQCRVFGTYLGSMSDSPSYKFAITISNAMAPAFYTSYAEGNCGNDTIVQTFGWPIWASPVGNYPCGIEYRGLRELIFSVTDADTSASSIEYIEYPFCVALLDTTYNNIRINITKYVPYANGLPGYTVTNPVFTGVRQ